MGSRIVETFSGAGRRRFIAQLSASSAALASGLFGAGSKSAEAHEERLAMAPAVLARQWDITTYRVRHSGRGTAAERIVAELLGRNSERLGDLVRTRRFRLDQVPNPKVENGVTQHYVLNKRFLRKEEIQLAWGNETIEVETNVDRGTFGIKYNGRHLGWATVSTKDQEASHEIVDILTYRSELLGIAAAIGQDLDRAFPPPPRDSETCCCNASCAGRDVSCWGYGLLKTTACASAEESCGSACWNTYCIGCCSMSQCNCSCVQGPFLTSEFLCTCIAQATACGCDAICI